MKCVNDQQITVCEGTRKVLITEIRGPDDTQGGYGIAPTGYRWNLHVLPLVFQTTKIVIIFWIPHKSICLDDYVEYPDSFMKDDLSFLRHLCPYHSI